MLLKCENVSFSYEGRIALQNVNFSVSQGDYVCVLGENGAGKSTLIKGLLKLLKPSEGKISFENGFSPKFIGYLPQQQSVKKDFPASVWEVVLSGNTNALHGLPFFNSKHKKRAMDCLEKLGITEIKEKSFRELSGGQQQRVLLARALCATKKLLILDEPASGLDPVATNELYSLIQKINREENITVIMVSHDIECAKKYAKHILHLATSQLFFGTVEDYAATKIGKKFFAEDSE
ncbi:MAG: metal ABC transporter ATP-binding protein [Treponema sp.]|nr:metal ABC transporter ATP-binding protein [Treponema sp.]